MLPPLRHGCPARWLSLFTTSYQVKILWFPGSPTQVWAAKLCLFCGRLWFSLHLPTPYMYVTPQINFAQRKENENLPCTGVMVCYSGKFHKQHFFQSFLSAHKTQTLPSRRNFTPTISPSLGRGRASPAASFLVVLGLDLGTLLSGDGAVATGGTFCFSYRQSRSLPGYNFQHVITSSTM